MPEYTLRNVDPSLWTRFTERANCDGWQIKPLLVTLMDSYASGEFTPSTLAPRELPEFAWLRSHYKSIANGPDFDVIDPAAQWERLFQHVLHSHVAMSWRALEAISVDKRREILN